MQVEDCSPSRPALADCRLITRHFGQRAQEVVQGLFVPAAVGEAVKAGSAWSDRRVTTGSAPRRPCPPQSRRLTPTRLGTPRRVPCSTLLTPSRPSSVGSAGLKWRSCGWAPHCDISSSMSACMHASRDARSICFQPASDDGSPSGASLRASAAVRATDGGHVLAGTMRDTPCEVMRTVCHRGALLGWRASQHTRRACARWLSGGADHGPSSCRGTVGPRLARACV